MYVGLDPVGHTDPLGERIVVAGSRQYRRKVEEQMSRMREAPAGRGLIERAEGNRRTTTIREPKGAAGNSATARNPLMAAFGAIVGGGSDVDLGFDPTDMTGGENDKGSDRRPPFVGLAHELGHANDMMNGRHPIDFSGRGDDEGGAIEAENEVRAEHGLAGRSQYGSSPSAQPKCVATPELRSCQVP